MAVAYYSNNLKKNKKKQQLVFWSRSICALNGILTKVWIVITIWKILGLYLQSIIVTLFFIYFNPW